MTIQPEEAATIRRATQLMLGLANELPNSPWTSAKNTEFRDEFGAGWDYDTHWITAPREPVETQSIALAWGPAAASWIRRWSPQAGRALVLLLNGIATEHEAMATSAHYLEVSDPEAAAKLRRGPRGLAAAVVVAQAFLGELPEIEDQDDDEYDEEDEEDDDA